MKDLINKRCKVCGKGYCDSVYFDTHNMCPICYEVNDFFRSIPSYAPKK